MFKEIDLGFCFVYRLAPTKRFFYACKIKYYFNKLLLSLQCFTSSLTNSLALERTWSGDGLFRLTLRLHLNLYLGLIDELYAISYPFK